MSVPLDLPLLNSKIKNKVKHKFMVLMSWNLPNLVPPKGSYFSPSFVIISNAEINIVFYMYLYKCSPPRCHLTLLVLCAKTCFV